MLCTILLQVFVLQCYRCLYYTVTGVMHYTITGPLYYSVTGVLYYYSATGVTYYRLICIIIVLDNMMLRLLEVFCWWVQDLVFVFLHGPTCWLLSELQLFLFWWRAAGSCVATSSASRACLMVTYVHRWRFCSNDIMFIW